MTAPASDWVGRQPGDSSPIIYLSGVANVSEQMLYDRVPYRYRCVSFAFLGSPGGAKTQFPILDFCLKNKLRIFLDSGAHSFQNLVYGRNHKNKGSKLTAQASLSQSLDMYMAAYVAFVKTLQQTGILDFCVTLDYVHNCKIIREVTQKLVKMGIRPIPVYHGDDSIDWLKRYIDDGHKLIGLSWSNATDGKRRKPYYDHVFDVATKAGVALHGFAQTGPMMFDWPFYSVDSATWLKAAAYGKIMDVLHTSSGRPKIREVAVSERVIPWDKTTKQQFHELREKAKIRGFDFNDLRKDRVARILYNLVIFDEISNKYVYRGSTWGRLL